jgi:hypothetical protein
MLAVMHVFSPNPFNLQFIRPEFSYLFEGFWNAALPNVNYRGREREREGGREGANRRGIERGEVGDRIERESTGMLGCAWQKCGKLSRGVLLERAGERMPDRLRSGEAHLPRLLQNRKARIQLAIDPLSSGC